MTWRSASAAAQGRKGPALTTDGTRRPGRTGQRTPGGRGPRPLPQGSSLFTPDPSPGRRAIERASATPLLWLHQLPVWVPPLLITGLLVTGLVVRGWVGAVALCSVAALLAWLAALSWPRLTAQGRVLRTAAIACVLLAAAIRVVRR